MVYTARPAPNSSAGSSVVACLRDRRTRMTLLRAAPRSRIGEIVTAGDVIVYLTCARSVDSSGCSLNVVDVARRIILRNAPVGYSIDAGLLAYESLPFSLVATPAGAVAWITERRGIRDSSTRESVYAAAPTGPVALLDEGTGIDPNSLALEGSELTWTDTGALRSATMP
jgi:hypothetical protein